MRRLCAILILTGALSAASGGRAHAHTHVWRPGVRSALRYAHERHGQIAFAVRIGSHLYGNAAERTFPSASVLKAMLMVSYLRRPSVRGRALRSSDMALLTPMIRRSDNAAASRVDSIVGNEGLRRLARRVGMHRFRPAAPIWGNSLVDATDQTRFFLHIDSFVPSRHRATALRLLASIVPSQRWGIGRVRPAGGLSTSRAAGAPAPAVSTIKSRFCATAGSALPWRSSPRMTALTPTARRRSAVSRRGCCTASGGVRA